MTQAAPAAAGNHKKRAVGLASEAAQNKKAHIDCAGSSTAASASCSVDLPPTWDAGSWQAQFVRATRPGQVDSQALYKLRRTVFDSTVEILGRGEYRAADGSLVSLNTFQAMQEGTVMYSETASLAVPPSFRHRYSTRVTVQSGDCLEAARDLMTDQDRKTHPSGVAVLNMACESVPGGGVWKGAGAQEENLCRRSALLASLYQFADFAEKYPAILPASALAPGAARYPIGRESGGVYTPATQVFRSSELEGYQLLANPYEVSFLTVPAIPRKYQRSDDARAATKLKMRAILRMAANHGHVHIVLSAFGCGAFKNPPAEVAEHFAAVFDEPEFKGVFRHIVFAIIDDHNANKEHNVEGNLLPFQRQFAGQEAAWSQRS